jgi:hypothetical protein
MTPAAASKRCTAKAVTGVGSGAGEAGGGHDLGGIPREIRRPVAGVETDHDRSAGKALVGQPRREAARCPAHDRAVHAVRAGPQRTAQARRAERQRSAEPIGELRFVPGVDQRLQLRGSGRINVVGDPRFNLGSAHHLLTIATAPRRSRSPRR